MRSDIALLNVLLARLDALSQQHLIRQRRTVESACGPQLTVSGHTVFAFAATIILASPVMPASPRRWPKAHHATAPAAAHRI